MNSHKLYNYEVSPPAEAWERIAQELEGVNEYKTVSQKLQNLQVAAPAFAWENINRELNDQQSFDIIAKKLSAVAIAPPVDMWGKIEANLNRTVDVVKKPAAVVPMPRKILKYAVAAAILGIISTAIYFLVQSSSKDANFITQTLTDNNKQTDLNQPVVNAQTDVKQNSVPANTTENIQRPSRATTLDSAASGFVTTSKGNAYTTTVEKNREVDGRYIVLMTEEGNVVRMNKKVSGLADCIAGEDASHECNVQIAAWQKEMASMPVLASPDNILGLLELANKQPVATEL